jgi:signal transduction histidine kinase
VQLIDGAIQAVKKISSELRPSVLDNLGLEAAVEWASKEFERRMGISCDLTLPPEPLSLDRNRSTVIYRVLQESLTNVARHAGATMVAVSLEKRDGEIRLSVRDNGRGVSKEEAEDPHAFGLIGMRERIEFLGGVFSIEGSKDRGTAVTAALPLGGESTGEEHGAA